MKPKQLRLDFGQAREPSDKELLKRVVRIESKLVQLMKFMGMTNDGRGPILKEVDPDSVKD